MCFNPFFKLFQGILPLSAADDLAVPFRGEQVYSEREVSGSAGSSFM